MGLVIAGFAMCMLAGCYAYERKPVEAVVAIVAGIALQAAGYAH